MRQTFKTRTRTNTQRAREAAYEQQDEQTAAVIRNAQRAVKRANRTLEQAETFLSGATHP